MKEVARLLFSFLSVQTGIKTNGEENKEQVDGWTDVLDPQRGKSISKKKMLLLPAEVQERILGLVGSDDRSLLSAEATCAEWRAILRRAPIYKSKCLSALRRTPALATSFLRHRFDRNCCRPQWCKAFYFGLSRLQRRGWTREEPKVTVADCMEAQVGGRKVDLVSGEWRQRHNYSGVYDMVYDREAGRLVCSVYDTIQVWDANSFECLKILGPELLDGSGPAGTRTICFYVSGDLLACGTTSGTVKILDLWSEKGQAAEKAGDGGGAVVDLKISGEEMLSVDCYGDIVQWRLEQKTGKLTRVGNLSPPLEGMEAEREGEGEAEVEDGGDSVHALYRRKNLERTLDFNDDVVVTNTLRLLVLFSRKAGREGRRAATFVFCPSNVLCLRVLGRAAYWGVLRGKVFRTDLYLAHSGRSRVIRDPTRECERMETRFQDNVTSLDVTEDRVVVGDVNGEVHVCSTDRFGSNKDLAPDFVLESGHSYRSFVWCVKMDAERIFSGDQDGKIVVHDFWRWGQQNTSMS